MRRAAVTIVLAAAVAGASPAVAATPPTLALDEAKILTRDAFERTFEERPHEVTCDRRERLRLACRTAARIDRFEIARAEVEITRSGTELSPIDTYELEARRERELTGRTSTERSSGRFVVESRRAPLGKTLRLLGEGGVELEVTVGPPVDPFISPNIREIPEPGRRFVAIEMTIRNVGTETYEAPFGPDVSLLLTNLERGDSRYVGQGCEHMTEVAPGELRRGVCRNFELDAGVGTARIDLDVGRETGRWVVAEGASRRRPRG